MIWTKESTINVMRDVKIALYHDFYCGKVGFIGFL